MFSTGVDPIKVTDEPRIHIWLLVSLQNHEIPLYDLFGNITSDIEGEVQ
jgi:hypothetical protein